MKGFKQGAQCGAGVISHGKSMGFAQGGQVKNTSGEFVMKTTKQSTMDHGLMPASKGCTDQEQEAGGTGRLKPGFKAGGKVAKKAKGGKFIQKAIKHPGALRKTLKVKEGEKIPAKKLDAAAKKPGVTGQRARLAKTLKKMG